MSCRNAFMILRHPTPGASTFFLEPPLSMSPVEHVVLALPRGVALEPNRTERSVAARARHSIAQSDPLRLLDNGGEAVRVGQEGWRQFHDWFERRQVWTATEPPHILRGDTGATTLPKVPHQPDSFARPRQSPAADVVQNRKRKERRGEFSQRTTPARRLRTVANPFSCPKNASRRRDAEKRDHRKQVATLLVWQEAQESDRHPQPPTLRSRPGTACDRESDDDERRPGRNTLQVCPGRLVTPRRLALHQGVTERRHEAVKRAPPEESVGDANDRRCRQCRRKQQDDTVRAIAPAGDNERGRKEYDLTEPQRHRNPKQHAGGGRLQEPAMNEAEECRQYEHRRDRPGQLRAAERHLQFVDGEQQNREGSQSTVARCEPACGQPGQGNRRSGEQRDCHSSRKYKRLRG